MAAKTGKIVAILIGMSLLAGVVAWVGVDAIIAQVNRLRWVLPVVVATGLLKHLLRTAAWKLALEAENVDLGFGVLLKARVASQAFAYLSGMGLLVSEPLRPWMLRKSVSVESSIAASLVESVIYWLTSTFVTTVGISVAIHIVAGGQDTVLLIAVWLAVFSALLGFLMWTRPLLPTLTRLFRGRLRSSPRLNSALQSASDTEAKIRSFRRRHPSMTIAVLGTDVLVQVVMFAEVWVVLYALGLPGTIMQLAAIEAGSRTVKMLSFYMPGRLGADEAGAAGAFALLGLDPATGVGLAIAKRVQGLVWAAVGLVWLGGARAASKFERPASPASP